MFERCSIMNRTYIAGKKNMQHSYLMIDSQAILPDRCFLISFGRAMANSWRPKDRSPFTGNISLSIDKRWRVDQTCTNTWLVHSSLLFQKVKVYFCDSPGTRTLNLQIRSLMLNPLSQQTTVPVSVGHNLEEYMHLSATC